MGIRIKTKLEAELLSNVVYWQTEHAKMTDYARRVRSEREQFRTALRSDLPKNPLETLIMWRSVKDELPPLEKPVWVSDGVKIWVGGRTYDDVENNWLWAQCDDNQFWFSGIIWDCDLYVNDAYEPTHWQLLPEPPKAT